MLILQQLKSHKRNDMKSELDYILKNIDDDLWKDFKAVAALQGKTVSEKLLWFIEAQGKLLPSLVLFKDRSKKPLNKGG